MIPQQTLRRAISCAGIGLHSGNKVRLSLRPAPADSGIRFRRSDLGGIEIPASVDHLAAGLQYATALAKGSATVETVEHLLGALVSQGIDNVVVELSHPEVPIMDGSASPFVYLIQEAGVRRLGAPRRCLKVVKPIQLSRGDKHIALYPAERFQVTYNISFDHPLIRQQTQTFWVTPETFAEEIAPARTFGFLSEVEMLRKRGLALGGSLDNAVVLGETSVLNTLRFDDEFVRHKILDAIGDLSLIGSPIIGHLVVDRGGHGLHTDFASRVLEQRDAWVLTDADADVAAEAGVTIGAAAAARG